MRESGLLLVERFRSTAASSIGLSSDDVRNRYRGFDGIAWPGETVRSVPLRDGLAPLSELQRLLAYTVGLDGVDLLYCDFQEPNYDRFRFLGYDVGYFESEYSHFSTVLHEIVFGCLGEMVRYGASLNDSLLFDSKAVAVEVIETRQTLVPSAGRALEEEIEIQPIAIFSVS